jgi:hypothetical protein
MAVAIEMLGGVEGAAELLGIKHGPDAPATR